MDSNSSNSVFRRKRDPSSMMLPLASTPNSFNNDNIQRNDIYSSLQHLESVNRKNEPSSLRKFVNFINPFHPVISLNHQSPIHVSPFHSSKSFNSRAQKRRKNYIYKWLMDRGVTPENLDISLRVLYKLFFFILFIYISMNILYTIFMFFGLAGPSSRKVKPDLGLPLHNLISFSQKAKRIQQSLKHSWKGYVDKAFGHDEVHPVTGRINDSWGTMGVVLMDSLDTLWIASLHDEFFEAVSFIQNSTTFDIDYSVSVFETSIRHLGGLIGGYRVSKHPVLLEKASLLADKLTAQMSLFHKQRSVDLLNNNSQKEVAKDLAKLTIGYKNVKNVKDLVEQRIETRKKYLSDPTIIPPIHSSIINLRTGAAKNHQWISSALLSEFTSIQLEMAALSIFSKTSKYDYLGQQSMGWIDYYDKIQNTNPDFVDPLHPKGLYPLFWDHDDPIGVLSAIKEMEVSSDTETDKPIDLKEILKSSQFDVRYSLGSFGDSFYEYLLKDYLLTGDETRWNQWIDSVNGIMDSLVQPIQICRHGPVNSDKSGFGDSRNSKIRSASSRSSKPVPPSGSAGRSGRGNLESDNVKDIKVYETASPDIQYKCMESAYLASITQLAKDSRFDHLVCYFPGTLALSAHIQKLRNLPGPSVDLQFQTAKKLLNTCLMLYFDSSTGLAPDRVWFEHSAVISEEHENIQKSKSIPQQSILNQEVRVVNSPLGLIFQDSATPEYRIEEPKYLLRPETIESLFYFSKIFPNEPEWADYSWQIFKSLETHCKTSFGYSGLKNVNIPTEPRLVAYNPSTRLISQTESGEIINDDQNENSILFDENWDDSQQSWFFAETLKYLYLTFSSFEFDLNDHVLSTEAHFMK